MPITPDACPGGEDHGAMRSYDVFNRLGLCPKPTSDLFYLPTPHQSRGVITATSRQPGRIHIPFARLNGRPPAASFVRQ